MVQRNRRRWYGRFKKDDNWVKNVLITLEAEGGQKRGRPRKTRKEVVDKGTNDLH